MIKRTFLTIVLLLSVSSGILMAQPIEPGAAEKSNPSRAQGEANETEKRLTWIDELNISLAVIAIVLSVVATVYGIKQNRDAAATLELAESAAKGTESAVRLLNETALQLPTRYVGDFPTNITEIIELLKSAQREITIVTDFAGYSSYSDQDAFRDYFGVVESTLRSRPKLDVRFYVYDNLLHQRMLQVDFPRTSYPKQRFSNGSDASLATFMKRMKRRHIEVTDYDSLLKALLEDEERCIRSFEELERCDCFELTTAVPIFLWMVDGRECIFAFENDPEKKKNYFSFRTRDGRLLEYFNTYLEDIRKKASDSRGRTAEATPAMNLLVPSLGVCNVLNGRLVPCNYHHDRLDVRFFEQADTEGERNIDEFNTELVPAPSLLDLLQQMDEKRMVAGSWGLMACHRSWLNKQLLRVIKSTEVERTEGLQILQLGTAGPVHYFGTAKVIAEALLLSGYAPKHQAVLHTHDRCLTPVAAVQCLLSRIGANDAEIPGREWALIDVYGLHKSLDPTFYNIGADRPLMRQSLKHEIMLEDLCADGALSNVPAMFDVAIAHFTFSMWKNESPGRGSQAYKNVARALRPGGTLLAALSELHNPFVKSVDEYHERLAEVGLHLITADRVWDVYDLTSEERQRLLYTREHLPTRKQVVLAAYRKV